LGEMADSTQTEAEFQVARDFVCYLDRSALFFATFVPRWRLTGFASYRQSDTRPELMAELKSVFAQYQKASTIAHAKDLKFKDLCFRMAGLRVMDKVRGYQSRVPWMARAVRVSCLRFFSFCG
jgi:hypothetical protein